MKILNEDMTGYVDEEVPVVEPATEVKKEEPVKEEKAPEPEAAKKDDEEKPKEGEPAKEVEEEEEEEEGEKPKEGEAEPEKEKEKEEEVTVVIDDYLAEKYKDYGIENEESLGDVLGTIKEIEEENTTLKAELEALKKDGGQIKFKSPLQEKAFKFVENFDPDRFGEGMQTFSTLITMDLEKADPRILLEEQFINETPELTREEALRKFNKDYKKKYELNRDTFDGDDAAYNEAVADLKLDLKTDAAKAKRYLAQKQKEYVPPQKEAEEKKAEINGTIQKSITAIDSELSEFIGDFNTITFSLSDDKKDDFHYKLSDGQTKQVQKVITDWVRNPAYYDAKGNLPGWNGAEGKVIEISRLLFGDDMVAKALKHGRSKGEIKRAEEIASKKPDRVAKVASTADVVEDDIAQWDRIAKEKEAQRAKKRYATS